MRMKHKASWCMVTLMDVVVAWGWGVAASVHMAQSRCKILDVFIVPVHLTGCPPSVAKVAATRVHTQKEGNFIMECMHTVRVYGRALSHCRYRELAEALCPNIQFNICCQIFWEDLSDKDFKLDIRSHNLPNHCVHHSEHYIFMTTSTTGCACDILQRTKDCQTTNREKLFVV